MLTSCWESCNLCFRLAMSLSQSLILQWAALSSSWLVASSVVSCSIISSHLATCDCDSWCAVSRVSTSVRSRSILCSFSSSCQKTKGSSTQHSIDCSVYMGHSKQRNLKVGNKKMKETAYKRRDVARRGGPPRKVVANLQKTTAFIKSTRLTI